MLRPLCSYEFTGLCRLMITLSKRLNEKYNLPKAPFTTRLSWVEIFGISIAARTQELSVFSISKLIDWGYICDCAIAFKRIVHDLLDGCRFNFRVLANYHLLLYSIGCCAVLVISRGIWGLPFFFFYCLMFMFLTTTYFVV